jgi:molybdopterin synthase catalytic subunit
MADADDAANPRLDPGRPDPVPPHSTQPPKITIILTPDPLDVPSFSAAVADPGAGATATFVGTTRDTFRGQRTLRLEYEAYEPMAVRALRAIAEAAVGKWELRALAIGHRTGAVAVGEASVAIAASSPHRADALAAVAWAIDELKATVPIWKKEFFEGGEVWQENAEQRLLVEAERRRRVVGRGGAGGGGGGGA